MTWYTEANRNPLEQYRVATRDALGKVLRGEGLNESTRQAKWCIRLSTFSHMHASIVNS